MNRAQMVESVYETLVACGITGCEQRATAEHVISRLVSEAGDEDAVFEVRRNAPTTSKAIVEKIRKDSLQDRMLWLFSVEKHPNAYTNRTGFTDDELELRMGRTHQSVSATRNTLMRKGYVVDSGLKRHTRSGNPAIVYVWTGKESP